MLRRIRAEWTTAGMLSRGRGRRERLRQFLWLIRTETLPSLSSSAWCKVVGHTEQNKMYDVICGRCRIVLRSRQ